MRALFLKIATLFSMIALCLCFGTVANAGPFRRFERKNEVSRASAALPCSNFSPISSPACPKIVSPSYRQTDFRMFDAIPSPRKAVLAERATPNLSPRALVASYSNPLPGATQYQPPASRRSCQNGYCSRF